MTQPTFDTMEAQASYGIGLQIGQQLQESGLSGLVPEAILAGITDALENNQPAVAVDVLHRALREMHERADAVRNENRLNWSKTACVSRKKTRRKKAFPPLKAACSSLSLIRVTALSRPH